MRFENKTVIVTGAARGLARSAARQLAAEGATLVLADLDEAGVKSVAAEINESSDSLERAMPIKVDVTSKEMINAMVDLAMETGGKIDAIINCAGGYHSYPGLIDTTEDEWQSIIDTNLK
ncbi:SDR family NAD(P)-dependent oxidoreductase, partial [Roseibium sp.]